MTHEDNPDGDPIVTARNLAAYHRAEDSMIAGEVVLIHVHEGTIISSWSFTSKVVQAAFERQHHSTWIDGTTAYSLRHLPDGTLDDPDSDTWIAVEGAMIEYVDGSSPQVVCGCGDPPSHGRGYDDGRYLHIEVKR